MKKIKLKELYSDIHFDMPDKTFDSDAMAKATVQMLTDPTNNIIAVMPDKDGKPVFIPRE